MVFTTDIGKSGEQHNWHNRMAVLRDKPWEETPTVAVCQLSVGRFHQNQQTKRTKKSSEKLDTTWLRFVSRDSNPLTPLSTLWIPGLWISAPLDFHYIWLVVWKIWSILPYIIILGIVTPTDSYFSDGLKPPTRHCPFESESIWFLWIHGFLLRDDPQRLYIYNHTHIYIYIYI